MNYTLAATDPKQQGGLHSWGTTPLGFTHLGNLHSWRYTLLEVYTVSGYQFRIWTTGLHSRATDFGSGQLQVYSHGNLQRSTLLMRVYTFSGNRFRSWEAIHLRVYTPAGGLTLSRATRFGSGQPLSCGSTLLGGLQSWGLHP